jgi:hypothetical protein
MNRTVMWLAIGLLALSVGCTTSPVRSDLERAEQRRQQQAQETRNMQQEQAAGASQFEAEQNDPEGYDGLAWGSPPSANPEAKQAEGHQPGRNLEKIVGAPGHADRYGQYVGDPNGELLYYVDGDSSPTFDYMFNEQKETYYAYYKGKLVYTVAKLNGDYRQVESELDKKYSVQGEIHADTWGNGSNDALNSHGSRVDGVYVGKLYRRGNTNTRIYLLQGVVNGFHDDLVLLYIPNAYLVQIHDEWWDRFQAKEQSAREQKEKQAEQIRLQDAKKVQ